MTSPGTANFVTRNEFELAMARIDGRFDQFEARLDTRFAQMDALFDQLEARLDARFAHIDTRFAQQETRIVEGDGRLEALIERGDGRLEALIERGDGRLEALIERRYVDTIRWTTGLSFGMYALMFGLILFVVARELAHP